jgi:hypothetical protein
MLIPFLCTSLAVETIVLAAVARKNPSETDASAVEQQQGGRTQRA